MKKVIFGLISEIGVTGWIENYAKNYPVEDLYKNLHRVIYVI